MASSYAYAYLAAFDTGTNHTHNEKAGLQPGTNEYNINLFFMLFFMITLCLNFIVDF